MPQSGTSPGLGKLACLICFLLVIFCFDAASRLAASSSLVAVSSGNSEVNSETASTRKRRSKNEQIVRVFDQGDQSEGTDLTTKKLPDVFGVSATTTATTEATTAAYSGDQLFYVDPHQSLAARIDYFEQRKLLWSIIARYNGLDPGQSQVPGSVLRIPDADHYARLRLASTSQAAPAKRPVSLDVDAGNPSLSSNFSGSAARSQADSEAGSLARLFDHGSGRAANALVTADQHNLTPLPPASDQAVYRKVDMFVGQARVFGKVEVRRVAVGNGGVIRAEVLDNGDLLVIAQSAGSSSLHLWHSDTSRSDFNIRVSDADPEVRVELKKSIKMRVKMIEFRRSALQRLGIDWGDSIEGPVFATAGDLVSNSLFRSAESAGIDSLPLAVKPFSNYFGIATELSSRINLLVSNGDAELLAEPVLSCQNGGTATFLAGGEIPYPTVGLNGQTGVEFREYGIRLEVSPLVDENGLIQASVMTEVSSIDAAVTVLGAPGLLTRRTQTQVNVHAGDTIVLAGLLQSETSKDSEGLPGLKKLPVFGRFFSTGDNNNRVSELVIFITPELVEPPETGLSSHEKRIDLYSQNRLKSERQRSQRAVGY